MDIRKIPTPAYVIDEKKMRENLEILQDTAKKAGL